MKIMKNLKNMKEEKRGSFFAYWNCCCWTANVTYLKHYYDNRNAKRKMLVEAMERMRQDNIGNIRPDIIRDLQRQIDLYDENDHNIREDTNYGD